MKKVIIGVFAHPDDEAFGPAGTLILEAEAGTEVHLVTLTNGGAGSNPHNHEDLGAERLKEWHQAGHIIGASSMHHLGYHDGTLSNTNMQAITTTLEELAAELLSGDIDELEFMSFEFGGISGHIDHIVAARAAACAFYRLKAHDARVTRLRLFCVPEALQSAPDTSWIFMDKGYADTDLEKIDVSSAHDKRVETVNAHQSQPQDRDLALRRIEEHEQIDHFIVRE